MEQRRGAQTGLVGKLDRIRPLGRPRGIWEDNVKIKLREVEWGLWTGLIWLRIGTGGVLL